MSDKTLRRLWAACLLVEGVCAVILGVLNIMGSELAQALTPVLCGLILFGVMGMLVLAAQIQKRGKK